MSTQDDFPGENTYRELREYARGELDVEHSDVHPHAGLVEDERVRRVLSWMAENYDPAHWDDSVDLPRSFWDTQFARDAIRKHGTEAASRAIRDGRLESAAFVSGLPSYKSDVSGLHAINQLVDWLVHSEQCKLVYLAALMGRGKTDLSLTMLETIHDHYRRLDRSLDDVEVETPEFAANFHVETPPDVDAQVREIRHFEELVEWGKQHDSDDVLWYIFDEASTELTAQSGANAQDVAETMAPFVKKMRKMGINMVVIGHDKGDVHPAIRSLADFVDKQGLKTASFYAGIKKREPTGHLFDLAGIPPTSWSFDTDDTAEWCWCDEEAENCPHSDSPVDDDSMSREEFEAEVKKRAGRLYALTPDEVGLEDVAQAVSTADFSISASTVSRWQPDDVSANATATRANP